MFFKRSKFFMQQSVLILALLGGMLGTAPGRVGALDGPLTLAVNSENDGVDIHPGDGVCETATHNSICTLRAAIQETNSHVGADTIFVPAGTYALTLPGVLEDAAASGDLDILDDLTISGESLANTFIDGNGSLLHDRVFHILDAYRVDIANVTIRNGNPAPNNGGGIANYGGTLNVHEVVLSDNTAGHGAALLNAGTSYLLNTTIANNIATDDAGGIRNDEVLTIVNSTINDNSSAHVGGGIANGGSLTLINSTVSHNQAGTLGGGIYVSFTFKFEPTTVANLYNTTITNNIADSDHDDNGDGGGIYKEDSSVVYLRNTIVAGNTNPVRSADCYGSLTSYGYNLIQSLTGCNVTGDTTGNLVWVDPSLSPLQNNGGQTDTHALQSGSPAIDAGDDETCESNDQRGVTRPQGNHCDIGAYEFEGDATAPTVTSIVRANASPTNAASVTFTVTFSEPVNGVAASDFILHPTGNVTGATVQSVSGSGAVYTVTVNTGTGNGTLGLRVPTGASITDTVGNPVAGLPFTSGQSYTILKAATFSDVEMDYWAWQYVEQLINAGITAGCGEGQYCPEGTVTRAQMAVFLERGIHGSSYSPSAVGGSTGFTDVPLDYWSGAWIKQLAADGVTSGCGGGRYCPESPVTRGQMAVFLLRAKYGASYAPPAVGNSTDFGDVQPGYWSAAWIKQLVVEGITAGCGNGNYCPESPVTRAQMAVFLVRTFNLP